MQRVASHPNYDGFLWRSFSAYGFQNLDFLTRSYGRGSDALAEPRP
jgi:hypothetical protein